MAVSKPCEHCGQVKKCSMYRRAPDGESAALHVYLCKPCARALGYRTNGPIAAILLISISILCTGCAGIVDDYIRTPRGTCLRTPISDGAVAGWSLLALGSQGPMAMGATASVLRASGGPGQCVVNPVTGRLEPPPWVDDEGRVRWDQEPAR